MKNNRNLQLTLLRLGMVVLLVAMGSSNRLWAQLSGNYTIDPAKSGTRNYTTINAAINALKNQGVSNTVVFSIADGTYNESIEIVSSISGLYSPRQVIFSGQSKDSSRVIIKSNKQNHVNLDQIRYLKFEHLTFSTSHPDGRTIYINRGAVYIEVSHCHITNSSDHGTPYGVLFNQNDYTYINNCSFDSLAMAIYGNGNWSSHAKGHRIIGNRINNWSTRAISLNDQEDVEVSDNDIAKGLVHKQGAGIYLYDVSDGSIERNKVLGGSVGISIIGANSNSKYASDSLLVANNFVKTSYGAAALEIKSSERVNLYHNSIIATDAGSALSIDKNNEFSMMNNHIDAENCYYGMRINLDSAARIYRLDFNNYAFSRCTTFAYLRADAVNYAALTALDTNINRHSQAFTVARPSGRNRQTGHQALNNRGRFVGIVHDVNRNKRPNGLDTVVDIGCLEFYLDSMSLEIKDLLSPVTVTPDSMQISCRLRNNGQIGLTNLSFEISYSVDSGKNWLVDTLKIKQLSVGDSMDFTFSKKLKQLVMTDLSISIAIHDLPGQNTGLVQAENTFAICQGLQGAFTVGANGDYKTIAQALQALSCGIYGPVEFKLQDGTYPEHLSFPEVIGASLVNTVTFRSQSGKAKDVVITNHRSRTTTIAAPYYQFEGITFKSRFQSGSKPHTVLMIEPESHHVYFRKCHIYSTQLNSSNTAHIQGADSIVFDSCHFYYGSEGVCNIGNGNSNRATANSITNSTFKYFKDHAYYDEYSLNSLVSGNSFDSTTLDTQLYLFLGNVQFYNSTGFMFNANKLDGYGILLLVVGNNVGSYDGARITNNQIISRSNSGIDIRSADSLFIAHNTLVALNGNVAVTSSGRRQNWVNNIFHARNCQYGIALQFAGGSLFDYNNVYIENTLQPIEINGVGYADGLTLINSGTFNKHGISAKPIYKKGYYWKPTTGRLNNVGDSTDISSDIAQNPRPLTGESGIDIGCLESRQPQHSLLINKLISPVSVNSAQNRVEVKLENAGTDTLQNARVLLRYSTDNGANYKYDTLQIGLLAPRASLPFSFTPLWQPVASGDFVLRVEVVRALTNESIASHVKSFSLCTGLSGKYTIGANGDFNTISKAVKALKCGISGPVVFKLDDGTYYEPIRIGYVKGTSSKNTITFKGSRKAIIEYHGTSTSDRYCVLLKGAQYIVIDGLTLQGKGAYASGVLFTENASHNVVKNTMIDLADYSKITTNVAICFSSARDRYWYGRTGSYNIIDSNVISGGSSGLLLYGWNQYGARGNRITHNQFNHITSAALLCSYDDSTYIGHNIFNDSLKQTVLGISMSSSQNFTIIGNKLSAETTIKLLNCNRLDESFTGLMANNEMVQYSSRSGFEFSSSRNLSFVHNSMYCTGRPFEIWSCDSLTMANNIFFSKASLVRFAIYASTMANWDYNNYYFPNASWSVVYNGVSISSFKALQQLTARHNQNSLNLDPGFAADDDLHLTASSPQMAGPYLDVSRDIDGDVRCRVAPMIGMDEGNGVTRLPSASFSIPDSIGRNYKLIVNNTGVITGGELVRWYINDTLVSTSKNLQTTFRSLGLKIIKLVHTGCIVADTAVDTIIVILPFKAPVANFYSPKRVYQTNEKIKLFDRSTHQPKEFSWSISPLQNALNSPGYFDRNFYWNVDKDSTSQTPETNIYYTGKYDVCLKVSNKNGADSICKKDYLEVREFNDICFDKSSSANYGRLFDSGGDKLPYLAGSSCHFLISTCEKALELELKMLDLGKGDYLRIYDGHDTKLPLWDAKQFPAGIEGDSSHNSVPEEIMARSGAVYIIFSADNNPSTVGEGFVLDWGLSDQSMKKPKAQFFAPDTVCLSSWEYILNQSKGAYQYYWDFSDTGVFERKGQNPLIPRRIMSNRVTLMVESYCGVTDTFSQHITVLDTIAKEHVDFYTHDCFVEVGDTVSLYNITKSCRDFEWLVSPLRYNGLWNRWRENTLVFEEEGFSDIGLVMTDTLNEDTVLKQDYLKMGAYCRGRSSVPDAQYGISQVSMSNLTQRSQAGALAYETFMSKPILLERDETYGLNISFGSDKEKVVQVWIDWNGDFDYDDRGELVLFENKYTGDSLSRNITIPDNCVLGKTRMRVASLNEPNGNDACATKGRGQMEDYRLIIKGKREGFPEIRLEGSLMDTLNVNESFIEPGYVALDPEDGNLSTKVTAQGGIDSSLYGRYVLSYTVTDSDGHTFNAKRYVQVTDFEKPVIKLQGGKTVLVDIYTSFVDPGFTVTDNHDSAPRLSVTGTIDTALFGTYILKYCATDKDSNKACISRKVIVGDTSNPSIRLIGADSVYIEVNDLNYQDSGYVFNDNDSANVQVSQSGSWQGFSDQFGYYTIRYTAEDRKGNKASATRFIKVDDTTAPTVVLIDSSWLRVERWSNYTDPGIVYADNYYDSSQLLVYKVGSVNTQSTGEYTITYQVADPRGNFSRVLKRTVEVVQTSSMNEARARGILAYPNPTQNQLTITAPLYKEGSFSLNTLQGKEVIRGFLLNGRAIVDLSQLAPAVYLLEIEGVQLRVVKTE